ncbi:hypothetical protein BGZ59_001506 [Podila verticillata]|nr:hypothetical protein BGZ59_001506 [Podila verticillata]
MTSATVSVENIQDEIPMAEKADTPQHSTNVNQRPGLFFSKVMHVEEVENLQHGLYYAVWSLNLANYEIDMFSPLKFASTIWNKDAEDMEIFNDIKVEADEMLSLLETSKSSQGNVTVRSPIQIFVDENTTTVAVQLEATHSKATENWTAEMVQSHFLVVNYVELHRSTEHLPNGDKNGPGTPLKTIHVCHKDPEECESATGPVKIDVSMVNSTGTFAATLSYTSTRGFLDLWELQPSMTLDTKVHQLPAASTSFPITRGEFGRPPSLSLSVSHDGSKIALFPSADFEKNKDGSIPSDLQFRLYSYNSSFTPAFEADEKQPLVHQLQLAPTIKDSWLMNFAGAGKFHFLSFDKFPSADEERFVASDGFSIFAYSTANPWSRHSSLELTSPSVGDALPIEGEALSLDKLTEAMIDGMHGPYFAWQATDKKSFSVWDLELLELVTTTVLPETRQGLKHVSFSSDGYLMSAMTADGMVTTYATKTGIAIHSSYFTTCFCRIQYVNSDTEIIVDSKLRRPFVKNPIYLGVVVGHPKRPFLPVTTRKHIRSVQLLELPVEDAGYIDQATMADETTEIVDTEPIVAEEEATEPVDKGQSADDWEDVKDVEQTKPAAEDETTESGDMESVIAEEEVTEQVDTDQSEEPKYAQEDFVYVQHGSALTVYSLRKETFWSPEYDAHREKCSSDCESGATVLNNKPRECTTPTGLKFRLELGERTRLHTGGRTDITIAILYLESTDSNGLTSSSEVLRMIHTDDRLMYKEAYFLPCKTRFLIWGPCYFQIWDLPQEAVGQCILVMMQARTTKQQMEFVRPCPHGHTIRFKEYESPTRLLYARPHDGDFVITDLDSCVSTIPYLMVVYSLASSEYRLILLKYLYRHINMRNTEGLSLMYLIIVLETTFGPSPLLKDLLHFEMDFLPPWTYVGAAIEYNPIIGITGLALKAPRHLTVVAHLIDYCIRQAKSRKNIGYMLMVLEALPAFVELHPDLALQVIKRCAYIPIRSDERALLMSHARVRPRPSLASWFGKKGGPHLYEVAEPVFQTRNILPNGPPPPVATEADEEFVSDIFVAPFDLIWVFEESSEATSVRTNWIKAIFTILSLKFRIKGTNRVEVFELGEELFDNPAISALLEYKWNTFASAYWTFRFVCQCLYYLLVLTVTVLQVYYPTPLNFYIYIPIVATSLIFLWLEFQQFLRLESHYFMSPYNIVDLVVYTLPLAGGVVGIVQGVLEVETKALRVWSFAILFIYIHILFELRVIKSVCKTVTIIFKAVTEIKVFFFIFAASILAFTHTFLHLLWARMGADTFNEETGEFEINHHASADYPRNPLLAFSATYFFIGGRLDPVGDLFSKTDTWFHIMMIIYFFFTVILMLNVLIALINVAFTNGDESWRFIWHDNRLRYIEAAENVTLSIPGFRRTHSWFPKMIYYTATQKEVEDYEAKNSKPVTSQLAREDNSGMEHIESLRKFVAMQVPLRPLKDDREAVVEAAVDANIAVEDKAVSVAVEAAAVVTAGRSEPAPVAGYTVEEAIEKDQSKEGALDLIQQRLDKLQAQDEILHKQLQDISTLLQRQAASSLREE